MGTCVSLTQLNADIRLVGAGKKKQKHIRIPQHSTLSTTNCSPHSPTFYEIDPHRKKHSSSSSMSLSPLPNSPMPASQMIQNAMKRPNSTRLQLRDAPEGCLRDWPGGMNWMAVMLDCPDEYPEMSGAGVAAVPSRLQQLELS